MTPELEKELYEISPVFFGDAVACLNKEKNEMDTCMYWGCECGDGWFEPLKKFAIKVNYINGLAEKHNFKFVCDQLKEKWGECTIYWSCRKIDETKPSTENDVLDDMFRDALDKCEKDCWNVCEWCGAEGGRNGENLVTTHGWISRICKKCAKDKAEKSTKKFDKENNREHEPRITWFQEGYEFLNPYHVCGFKYKDGYYQSIIEAFYSIKDKKHEKIYHGISGFDKQDTVRLIEDLAYEFGFEMKEEDYDLLKEIVKAKFTYKYNEDLREELLETRGKLLSNMGKHHNNIWGYCVCDKCKDKEKKDLYAKLLMEVREEIFQEKSK